MRVSTAVLGSDAVSFRSDDNVGTTLSILNLCEFEVSLSEIRDAHREGGSGSGRFSRVLGGGADIVGGADFTIIDYTFGPWPKTISEHDARVDVLREKESSATGLFIPDSLLLNVYILHVLEILGARPLYPFSLAEDFRTPSGLSELIDTIDEDGAWGANIASIFAISGDIGPEWFDRFFTELDNKIHATNGLWTEDLQGRDNLLTACSNFIWLYMRYNRAWRHPEALAKTVSGMQQDDGLFAGDYINWTEVHAANILRYAMRSSKDAFECAHNSLTKLAEACGKFLDSPQYMAELKADSHILAAFSSLLGLIATAIPGSVIGLRPVRSYFERTYFV